MDEDLFSTLSHHLHGTRLRGGNNVSASAYSACMLLRIYLKTTHYMPEAAPFSFKLRHGISWKLWACTLHRYSNHILSLILCIAVVLYTLGCQLCSCLRPSCHFRHHGIACAKLRGSFATGFDFFNTWREDFIWKLPQGRWNSPSWLLSFLVLAQFHHPIHGFKYFTDL